jgi:ATP-grasp domain, R2K clade family 2
MKLLLQSDWQADNMTAPVKQAIQQLAWKVEDIWRENVTLNWLQLQRDLTYTDYTPIGTVEFVKTFAEKIGVTLPKPIHATELIRLEGRKCWVSDKKRLTYIYEEGDSNYPCFVKPYDELKKFTGFVAKSDKDFDLYPEVDWNNTKLFVTDVLDNIVSEWRCYVLKGKVFACVNYLGDPLQFPYKHTIEELIERFSATPIAYSLDVAVSMCKSTFKWSTQFIEINDAYALGYYGGDVELYTKMLNERWKEIAQNQ